MATAPSNGCPSRPPGEQPRPNYAPLAVSLAFAKTVLCIAALNQAIESLMIAMGDIIGP
ncbi:hypothetical protein RSAG8_10623, partial [Rhizoctonia solani AG-8 WAC10335]